MEASYQNKEKDGFGGFPDWDADKCWNLSRQEKDHCRPVSTRRKREGIVVEHI
jgi:hypothetical protein